MALITSGTFSKALLPGVNKWYGKSYDEFPVEWTPLFDKHTSRKAFEEDVGVSGLGLAAVKPEGQNVQYDTEQQAYITRYTHVVYALGFMVTREAMEDDQYDVVAEKRARALAFSMRQTKEIIAANVYNRAFTSGYNGGDGVTLGNASHPFSIGGTWSNILATAANLSEAALEQSIIDMGKWTNDRGLRIAVMPKSLHIPVDLQFEAERILKSQYRIGTANNDVSALVSMGKFPGGAVVNHYFTSSTAWFLRTNVQDGMKYFERRGDSFDEDNSFDNDVAKFKAQFRCSFGWTDPRGFYGTPGVQQIMNSKEYHKLWFTKNKDRLKKYRKAADLKKNYGISLEKYNEMLVAQGALCFICKQPETQVHPKSGLPYQLSVDHCHTTNKIRSLLCNNCNRTLGMVNDNVELLQKMIDYVNLHKSPGV